MGADITDHTAQPDRSPRVGRRGWRTAVIAAATAVTVSSAAIVISTLAAPEAAAAGLIPFDSCEALDSWYTEAGLAEVGPYGLGGPMTAFGTGVPEAASADESAGQGTSRAAAGGLDAGVGTSESGTNVQEAGVDEPAVLKTGSGVVYTMVGTDLVLTDVTSAAVVARVSLNTGPGAGRFEGGGGGGELLLSGDRVVVLSYGWIEQPGLLGADAADDRSMSSSYVPGIATTVVTTVDVSDPAAPAVVASLEVEGNYLSARAAGGSIRLVTTSLPSLVFAYPGGPSPTGSDGAVLDEAAATEFNREVIRAVTADAWLPQRITRTDDGAVTRGPVLDCAAVAHPGVDSGLGTLTVMTLDPLAADDDGLVVDADAVTANGENVYASTDRLYVATTAGGWNATGITDPATDLHGFDVSLPQQTTYLASGTVDGWLLGRWAISAEDGYLRVATTTSSPRGETSAPDIATDEIATDEIAPDDAVSNQVLAPAPTATQSSVHVLAEADGALVQVGRLDGLGPDESIRAVRWFGDIAVIVTFRQTDPLYTVDLSDPTAPRTTGELKVTGYSAYLHPIGGSRLLGIGQEATTDGVTTGTKAEMFDLTDLTAPRSVASMVWPDSSSQVEWDSRAFTYLPERSMAIVPVDFYPQYTEEPNPGVAGVEPLRGSYGPSVLAVDVAGDAVVESARWSPQAEAGQAGWSYIEAVVVTGDSVVVRLSGSTADGAATTTSLVVLAVDDLAVEASVAIG